MSDDNIKVIFVDVDPLLTLQCLQLDNNFRYRFHSQIILVIVTGISVVIGQKFTEQRAKLKFRPPGEWFANMQPSMDQSPSYFEQSDQPVSDSKFTDLYVEDFDPEGDSQFSGGSKFARHPSQDPPVFQSLCPTKRTDIFLNTDSDYEYRPSSYVEVKCSHPFGRNAILHQQNKVCGHHGFSCIQLNRTIFLTRRMLGSDCWEVETRVIPSGCECMWPKHRKGKGKIILEK